MKVGAQEKEAARRVLEKMAEVYGLEAAEVSVTFTDNAYIRELNATYRGKDAATDVLSFALREGEEPPVLDGPPVEMLGDIIISVERAAEQAAEYGHSLEREIAFLTTHGMLHLLGYDHIEAADRVEMRAEEEHILQLLGISRE